MFTLLLFGYALDTRVRNVPTAIEDLDQGIYSRALITDFAQSPVFRVVLHVRWRIVSERARSRSRYHSPATPPRDVLRYDETVVIWVDGSDAVLSGQTARHLRRSAPAFTVRIALDGTQLSSAHYRAQTLFNRKG